MSLSIPTDPPETQPPITHNNAWDEAIKRAALEFVNSPDFVPESGRLRAAIAFVRAGAVRLFSDGSAEVMSDTTTYVLNPDCKCADAEHRGPQCKHFLAVQVMRRALEIHWDMHGPATGSAASGASVTAQREALSPLPAPERPRRMVDEHPWMQSEPPLLYSRKWHDPDGDEHMVVVRATSQDDLWKEVKRATQMVEWAKQRYAERIAEAGGEPEHQENSRVNGQAATASSGDHREPVSSPAQQQRKSQATADPWCAEHDCVFDRILNRKTGEYFLAHKDPHGKWCRPAR